MNEITEKVIGAAYEVGNELGSGFLEKVYENALCLELGSTGLAFKQQAPIEVRFKDRIVGEYFADILVEDSVIVELKVVKEIDDIHLAQCLNYLKATGLKVGLVINFHGTKVKIKRVVNDF